MTPTELRHAIESNPAIARFLAATDEATMSNGETVVALTMVLAEALVQGDKTTLTESIGFILAHVNGNTKMAAESLLRLCLHCCVVKAA